jgi:hypothetical protein
MPRALPWSLLLLIAGAAMGWLGMRWPQACSPIGSREFAAKTVVCRDGVAYALIPMTTDVRVLERQLQECRDAAGGH